MRFTEVGVAGAQVIDVEAVTDERGFFARTWCEEEFARRGLSGRVAQCSISVNRLRGTIRGMHVQVAPHEEVKLVRCSRGAIYDVVLDVRRTSPTFLQWHAVELNSSNCRMLYVPAGCAHGFQTLADDTEVVYQISESYHPESARGFRWDDPAFAIEWPLPVSAMSDRDRKYPDFRK